MSYRYDFSPITREQLRKQDNTLSYATVCRDGILTYYTGNGRMVKELRPASANRQPEFLEKLLSLPIVVEHPPVKLQADPNHPLKVGNIVEVIGYDPQNSNVGVFVKIDDPEIKQKVLNGDYTDVSLGYTATILETPDGVYYDPIDDITYVGDFDRVQINIKPDHLAITKLGRAGETVRIFPHLQKIKKDSSLVDEINPSLYNIDDDRIEAIRYDSYLDAGIARIPRGSAFDQRDHQVNLNGRTTMNKTFRRDSIEFSDVPEAFANWVHERLDAMDEIYRQLGEVQAENETLREKVTELQASEQQNAGRADALEEVCEKAVKYLAKQGYKWDSMQRDFVRVTGRYTPNSEYDEEVDDEEIDDEEMGDEEMTDEEMGDEEMGDEEMIDEEMPHPRSSKKKKSRVMRDDAIASAIAEGLKVRGQAIQLLDAYHVDSSTVDLSPHLTPTKVQAGVIKAIKPNAVLYDNPVYIQARFDALYEEVVAQKQNVSQAEALRNKIAQTRQDGVSKPTGVQLNENYKKPLKVSTRVR